MYFEFTPNGSLASSGGALTAHLGHSLLKEVECEIGGQKIDKHYSHWLATWNQLTEVNPTGASTAVTSNNCGEPTGDATLYQMMSHNHQGDAADCVSLAGSPNKVMVPLQFWFNRNPGLALPLIALQYHEVKIKITFAAAGELLGTPTGTSTLQDPTLWAQYIYLDTDEDVASPRFPTNTLLSSFSSRILVKVLL